MAATAPSAVDWLNEGGEMGRRISVYDWSKHPLGPIAQWPQSLKIAVRIMLTSRYAMWMGWGTEFFFFCNDAYLPTVGIKEKWVLGASARKVWAEIWQDIGPRAESVVQTGKATWDESLRLYLERSGYPEETYHTFSYSPVSDDTGRIGGMLCVVTEDTERVIGDRRLALLRELGADLAAIVSEKELFEAATKRIGLRNEDLPFALVYLFDEDQRVARLAGATGFAAGSEGAPATIDLTASATVWPAQALYGQNTRITVHDLAAKFSAVPQGPWTSPPRSALIVPIARPGQEIPAGFLVVGINPFRPLDAAYSGFIDLLAGQISAALTSARTYEAERRRAEALAEIDRAKTAFFSNVSHEFRTPLTLLLGPLEDLLRSSEKAMAPEQRDLAAVAHRNGLRLLKLVNTLLDFSRIEAGRMQPNFEPVDLAALTSELASSFRSAIEKAGLQLVVDCAPLDQLVQVDRDMWEKIVLNLLSNAFKFTLQGEIRLRLAEVGESVVLSVTDTGTGIPAESLPQIFERFYRVPGAKGRTHEGTGIGLAFIQELAKMHGGTVAVTSVLGQGSTFSVTLPRSGRREGSKVAVTGARPAERTSGRENYFTEEASRWRLDAAAASAGLPPAAASNGNGSGHRPKILLADDNADMREYVTRLLSDQFDVITAPDGEAAFLSAARHGPDLVLTDVMMPRLDGFGLLKKLRAAPALREIPVILLSARAGEESRVEGIEHGADDYLIKPFSARELVARVRTHVQLARARKESLVRERRLKEDLKVQVGDLQRLHAATLRVARAGERDAALEEVLIAAADAVGTTHGLLSLCTGDKRGVRPAAVIGFDHDFLARVRAMPAEGGVCGATFSKRSRIVVEDFQTDPMFSSYRETAAAGGFRSCHSVPLISSAGQAVGVLTLHFAGRHAPDERERQLVDLYGQMAADLLERTQALQNVRESEERLRLATTASKVGIWDWDIENDRVSWSDSLYLMYGMKKTEGEGAAEAFRNRVVPEDRERVAAELKRALEEDVPYEVEFRASRADGQVIWVYASAVVVRDRGRPVRMLGASMDITARRKGEEASRWLAAIVASSEDAIISKNLNGIITSWNKGSERVFGYRAEEIVGKSVLTLIPPDLHHEEPGIMERIRRGEPIEHYRTRRQRKDGTVFDVSLTVSPIRSEDGTIIGASKIARDITEQTRIGRALGASEERFRHLADNIAQFAWIIRPDGTAWFNRRFLDFTGLTSTEVETGWTIESLHHPEHKERVTRKFWEHFKSERVWEDTFPLRGKDGEYRWFLARALPIRDEQGGLVHWLGTHTDITDLRTAQEAMQARERQLRLVTDSAPVYLVQINHEHRFTFANRPYAARYGREISEVVGAHISELTGKEAYEVFRHHIDAALQGRRVEYEIEVPYETLGRRWVHVIYVPEFSAVRQVTGIVAVIMDVTLRKRIEQEVERARDQALAASRAKDDFLAALSHELRTPLNPVLLLASEAARNPAWPEEARDTFETIRKNAELEARLIDDLLDLTRISRNTLSLDRQLQDLRSILDDAIATVKSDLEKKRITFTLRDTAAHHAILGDGVRLQQIFWNVLKNAVKFTPEQGRVTVEVRESSTARRLVIEVSDTGIGLTAEEKERIFEAFVQGEHAAAGHAHRFGGVGLGLAISRILVELHGGSIQARSEGRNQGATFTIELPLADPAEPIKRATTRRSGANPLAVNESANALPAKGSAILVVDDHEPTRQALMQLLGLRGFRVVGAGSVAEATSAAAAARFDLLISDIGLPDGTGYELMSDLARRHGLKGIAVSGYGMEHDVARSRDAGFVVHLTKPVSMPSLEQALATLNATIVNPAR
jgi:PAS domain S-box-containing protein